MKVRELEGRIGFRFGFLFFWGYLGTRMGGDVEGGGNLGCLGGGVDERDEKRLPSGSEARIRI